MRAVDLQIDQMIRSRDLRVRETRQDELLPSRRSERLDQYHRGVRIVGGEVTRQIAADGTVSVFGVVHTSVEIGVTPRVSPGAARAAMANALAGAPVGDEVELVVLALSDGYHLAYRGQVTTATEIVNVHLDAMTGTVLQQFSDFSYDGLVGAGKGAYGDDKKISTRASSGTFLADDQLRPSTITTYDMRGNLTRLNAILTGLTPTAVADIASDADNTWSDSTVVDAHVYAGWYYDFLFKRFGRHGIDGRDLRIPVFTHPVKLEDVVRRIIGRRRHVLLERVLVRQLSVGPARRGGVRRGRSEGVLPGNRGEAVLGVARRRRARAHPQRDREHRGPQRVSV